MPEPDGPQFQHLWDIAMSDANDTLDAVSDEDLDEAVAESMISDAIGGMVDASQIEETGHTQAELSPQDRAFANRHQATYDAAEGVPPVVAAAAAARGGEIVYGEDGRMRGMAFSGDLTAIIGDPTRIGNQRGGPLPGENFYRDLVDSYSDMNPQGPDYSQPDPFDRSDPEEARQAKAIEAMNETLGE